MKKIFTLFAVAMMALCANAQSNHFIKVTAATDKANPWDSQLFIKVGNAPSGVVSKAVISVKSTATFTIGTESMDDIQTDHKDPYGGSAVFNYTDEIKPTADWDDYTVWFPGKTNAACTPHETTHEDFEYSATTLLLNIGKLPKGESVCFDNLRLYDTEGNLLFSEDFESNPTLKADDKAATAHYVGWQQAGWTFEIDEVADHVIEDYMLKITIDEAKANSWDSQVLINLPAPLTVGNHYAVQLSLRTEEGETDKIGAFIEDTKSENKDQYGNSGDLKYSNNFSASTTWSQTESIFATQAEDGSWYGGTDGKYPYDRLVLQLGKFSGTLYVDNIKIIEFETGDVQVIDFKEGIIGSADQRSWHSHVTIGKAESDCPTFENYVPTAIQNVETAAESNVMYNIAGQRVQNAKGLVIKNGKKMIF